MQLLKLLWVNIIFVCSHARAFVLLFVTVRRGCCVSPRSMTRSSVCFVARVFAQVGQKSAC